MGGKHCARQNTSTSMSDASMSKTQSNRILQCSYLLGSLKMGPPAILSKVFLEPSLCIASSLTDSTEPSSLTISPHFVLTSPEPSRTLTSWLQIFLQDLLAKPFPSYDNFKSRTLHQLQSPASRTYPHITFPNPEPSTSIIS